jgi:hypothetical protein
VGSCDFGGDGCHLFPGEITEGAAGCGQDDALDCVALVFLQHLKYGIVLAVHRQQLAAAAGDGRGEQIAGGDQALLVGKSDVGAVGRCRQRRGKAGDADDAGNQQVGVPRAGFDQCGRARACLDA